MGRIMLMRWRYLDAVAMQALVAKRIPSVSCVCSNQLLNSVSGSTDSSELTSSILSIYFNDVVESCGLGIRGCSMLSETDVIHRTIRLNDAVASKSRIKKADTAAVAVGAEFRQTVEKHGKA